MVIFRVWEAGMALGEMTGVVLIYWVLGKEVWQLIPRLPGLWLHILSDACCLSSCCSSFHPPAAVWSPHGFVGEGRVVGGRACISVCVRECSGNWQDWLRVSGCPLQGGWHVETWPTV